MSDFALGRFSGFRIITGAGLDGLEEGTKMRSLVRSSLTAYRSVEGISLMAALAILGPSNRLPVMDAPR